MSGVYRKSQLVLRPELGESLADISARLYARERNITNPPATSTPDLTDVANQGWLDDGIGYAHDFSIGQQRPAAPQLIPFSYPGNVTTSGLSGPHVVVLGYAARIYMLTLGLSAAGSSDTTVAFYLNDVEFQTLTLAASALTAVMRAPNPYTWPALGGNETDVIQVATTVAGGDEPQNLVACVRIV